MAQKKKLIMSKGTMPPPEQVYWRQKHTGDKFEPVPPDPAYLYFDKHRNINRFHRY